MYFKLFWGYYIKSLKEEQGSLKNESLAYSSFEYEK